MTAAAEQKTTVFDEIRTALRHTAVYGLGSVLAKALGFFMLPVYTRFLTPGDYGVLEILDLSMSLLGMVLHMGIAPALLRSYAAAGRPEEKNRVVSTAFIFVGITGALTLALGAALVRPVSAALFGPAIPSHYLLLSFTSFVLGYITALPRTYLRALEASGAFTAVESSGLFVMLALNIYFVAFLKIGLVGILWSSVLVTGAQAILLSVWVLRRVGIGFSAAQLRHMTKFGLPLILSNLAVFALNFSDRFFLQHLRSIEIVGLYAVGYKFAFMINYLLVQPFYVMWQSRMYAIHANPQHPKIFGRMFVLYSLVLTYAALALATLSPEIMHVMVGPQFSGTAEIIPIVALAYVFYGISYYAQVGMFITNNTKLIGAVSAGAAVLNLALNYVLISHYGMMGAAWATLLSFATIAAGCYYCSQRVFPLPLGIRRVAVAMGLATGVYLFCRWSNPESLSMALAVKGLVLLAYPLVLWMMGMFSGNEPNNMAFGRVGQLRERVCASIFGRAVNL